MFDVSEVQESHKVYTDIDVGIYEVARLSIPESKLYHLKTIWQLVSGEADSFDPDIVYHVGPNIVFWEIRQDRDIQVSVPFLVAAPQGMQGQPLGGWSRRDVVTDAWGVQGLNHDFRINGPTNIRMFANVIDKTGIEIVGGRLIAYNVTDTAQFER